jgi:hypothetical protein
VSVMKKLRLYLIASVLYLSITSILLPGIVTAQPQSCGVYACGSCPAPSTCGPTGDQCCCFEGCQCQNCDCSLPPTGQPSSCPSVCYNSICSQPTNTPPPTPTPPPLPTQGPCGGPDWIVANYVCNIDGTAQVTWDWDPVDQAYTYLLEYNDATSPPFQVSNLFYNTWFLPNMASPDNPRTSRVRVDTWETGSICSGQSNWSPTVTTSKYCVDQTGGGGGTSPPLLAFCDQYGNQTSDPSLTGEIYTAIGCIPVEDLQSFASFVLSWSIMVAGGITFILIIYAGYLYITSGGNPKKIQAAKELIFAALSGILLLIFSIFALRLIGVDILRIPGF